MWINVIVYIILVPQWAAGEKAQPSSGHMCEKRPHPSSYFTKSGRMSGMLVSGKNFSITKYNVWRHWWHSRSQISHQPSDILLTCTCICRGLDGPTCSECLPVGTCDFEPPEHVPRMSARAHTCALVFRRAPFVPRSPEHEKRPAAAKEKNADGPKKHIYTQ